MGPRLRGAHGGATVQGRVDRSAGPRRARRRAQEAERAGRRAGTGRSQGNAMPVALDQAAAPPSLATAPSAHRTEPDRSNDPTLPVRRVEVLSVSSMPTTPRSGAVRGSRGVLPLLQGASHGVLGGPRRGRHRHREDAQTATSPCRLSEARSRVRTCARGQKKSAAGEEPSGGAGAVLRQPARQRFSYRVWRAYRPSLLWTPWAEGRWRRSR